VEAKQLVLSAAQINVLQLLLRSKISVEEIYDLLSYDELSDLDWYAGFVFPFWANDDEPMHYHINDSGCAYMEQLSLI
jgi:hypothetical protein